MAQEKTVTQVQKVNEVTIESRGPVRDTIKNILGGLRSACTMIGARRIKDIPKCATFVMVNNQQNQVYA